MHTGKFATMRETIKKTAPANLKKELLHAVEIYELRFKEIYSRSNKIWEIEEELELLNDYQTILVKKNDLRILDWAEKKYKRPIHTLIQKIKKMERDGDL